MDPQTTERPAAATDDEVFLLPTSGLYADESAGAGHVQLSDNFYALAPEVQLAILAGWRRGIEESFARSLVQAFRNRYGQGGARPLPERLDAFRRDFAARGIDVPPDFALALQRY